MRPNKEEKKKKPTPREDWLREHGVTIGWAYVAGDPHKEEFVEFCIFLRKTKRKQNESHGGVKLPLFEYEWKPMSYSMGPGLFGEWKAELKKGTNFHNALNQEALQKKYLRPDVESFLASLILDVREIATGADFATWVDDYGMNEDAKRAHEVWAAVQHAWSQLRELLGRDAYKFAALEIDDEHT